MLTDSASCATDGALPVTFAPPLEPGALRAIERQLHLRFNKWDTQVGDVSVLCEHPLVMRGSEWDRKLYRPLYSSLDCPDSPLEAWGRAIESITAGGHVALLSAPGYLEDQQVLRAGVNFNHKIGRVLGGGVAYPLGGLNAYG